MPVLGSAIVSIDRYLTQLDTHENAPRSLDTRHLLLILYPILAAFRHKYFPRRYSFTDVSVQIISAKSAAPHRTGQLRIRKISANFYLIFDTRIKKNKQRF
jgi:hypothetical protein